MRKFGILAIVFFALGVHAQTTKYSKFSGPYLGQKPPGMTPELFAPGIVSTGQHEHSSPVFTANLKEIYWSAIIRYNGVTVARTTFVMKEVNGVWSKPVLPAFAKKFQCCENPFISPDGKRLYFSVSKTLSPLAFELFFVERIGNDWSEPIKMKDPFNAPGSREWQPTISNNGTIYFVGDNKESTSGHGIFVAKFENDKYQKPILANGFEYDFSPYLAPDESYIIFYSRREGQYGNGDLFICFKNDNGSWGDAINMGSEINTEFEERFPNVSPDGKFLFFNRSQEISGSDPNGPGNGYGDVYWVDAKVIEELKKTELQGN